MDFYKKNTGMMFLTMVLLCNLFICLQSNGATYFTKENLRPEKANVFNMHLKTQNVHFYQSADGRKSMKRADQYEPYQIVKTTLSNGLKVWLVEDKKLPYLDFTILFGEGLSRDLKSTPGAMYLLSQMLDKGTDKHTEVELLNAVELLGASIDVSLDQDSISLSMEGLSDLHESVLDLFSEVVMSSVLPRSVFEREKKKAVDSLKISSENFSRFADRILVKYLFENHPYGHYPMGTVEGLKSVTYESVRDLYKSIFQKEKALLVVSGNYPAGIIKKLENSFQEWKSHSVQNKKVQSDNSSKKTAAAGRDAGVKQAASGFNRSPVLLVDQPAAVQSEIRVASPCLHKAHPDYLAFVLANYVLGGSMTSRLMADLRVKRGFTYGVASILTALKHTGALTVKTAVRNQVLGEAIKETRKILEAFLDKGITEEELKTAKMSIKLKFISATQSADNYGAYLADNLFILGVDEDYFRSLFKNLSSLSREEVNRVIKKHFHLNQVKILVLSPAGQVKAQLKSYPNLVVKSYSEFL